MKKILLALLLSPLLFTACKRGDDTPPVASFIINGVHDVTLNNAPAAANTAVLALGVTQTATTQEVVNLSVTGLPAGVNASFSATSGTPSFVSTLTFSWDYHTTPAGTYPVNIIGTSVSGTKPYSLNLVVPDANGWVFDGDVYTSTFVVKDTSQGGTILAGASIKNGDTTYAEFFFSGFSPAAGTYKIVPYTFGPPSAANEVATIIYDGQDIYSVTGAGNPTLTLNIKNGKMSVNTGDVETQSIFGGSGRKTLSVYNIHE